MSPLRIQTSLYCTIFQNVLTLNLNSDFVNTLQVEVAAGLLGFYLSGLRHHHNEPSNQHTSRRVLMRLCFVIKISKAANLNESKRC